MQLNRQPQTPREVSDGKKLLVHSVFNTIQGEGPYAGRPALFLRLAGCNLRCPLCDTEYTDGAVINEIDGLVEKLVNQSPGLIVITGGEPFRQNLGPLLIALTRRGQQTQVETNGKLHPQAFDVISALSHAQLGVVVSPKTAQIDDRLAALATAFKYVVTAGDIYAGDNLPKRALGHMLGQGKHIARPPRGWTGDIFIQPADAQDPVVNTANMKAAVACVLARPQGEVGIRRRLCLQTHKYAGLD